ncbi:hypothetical protein [Erythrobacter sp.]|uniref:hypothetical protein n=1 Tax=Erythrobacter sp. TaxID=1042 RepID=UPI0025DEBCD3|nr:hypothetical protein [Erythrobacter sp.]
MSDTLARLDAFHARWHLRLNADGATVRIAADALAISPGLHAACADAFVTSLGLTPIGGNWELLDAEAGMEGPRSARAALVEAFARNMVIAQQPWLGEDDALAMGEEFLGCFDPGTRQIVTNRMYFGWNPITTASIEWAFVAFDDGAIALLLATAES